MRQVARAGPPSCAGALGGLGHAQAVRQAAVVVDVVNERHAGIRADGKEIGGCVRFVVVFQGQA